MKKILILTALISAVAFANLTPGGGGGSGGTVDQGNAGATPWLFDLEQILGLAPSVTNYLPIRVSNGTSYVDPTQIRALSSGTDSVAVTAASLPLPSGAATAANQATANGYLSSLDSKIPAQGQALMAASTPVVIASNQSAISVSVANFPATQPISAVSLPLPTGAATESTLSALNAKVVTTVDGIKVDGSAVTQPVSASSLPLPSGASTESTLSTLNGKVPSQGQALMTASVPVAIASDQSAIPVTGTFYQATQPVSGTVTANIGTTNGLALDATVSAMSSKLPATLGQKSMANAFAVSIASDQSAVPVSGTFFQATQPVSVASLPLPSGAATESTLSTLNGKIPSSLTVTSTRLLVDGSGVTQPVSAASLPLPSGASTAAKQPALGTAGSASADVITVQGIASMTALKVDGSAVTQPVSAASLPLPSGAATSANQTTANSSLSSIDGKLNSLGQKTMANSAPIVIASDQTAVPASQSGTWNINNVSGTVSLPTGAATEESLAKLTLTQGSTTSGQSGTLMQGAVTTAAPSYTTAQTSPLSLTTSGLLRVDNSGANSIVVGNVASAATDSGNPVKIGGKFNSSGITLTDGQRGDAQLDKLGHLEVSSNGSFSNIQAAATTTLKSGAGNLLRICLGTNGGNGHTLQAYDNTAGSGTKIALITTSGNSINGHCADYNLKFATGLTVVTSSATDDWTVVYQ